MNINAEVILSDSNGDLLLQVSQLSIDITNLDIEVHGDASWFYQILVDIIKGQIKDALSSALTSTLKQVLNSLAKQYASQTPLTFQVGPNFFLDYGLTANPVVTSTASATFHNGGWTYLRAPSSCTLNPPSPPTTPGSEGKPFTFYLSSTMFSCLGQLLYRSGLLPEIEVNQKNIPRDSPIQFNTSDPNMQRLFPSLYATYPNLGFVIDVDFLAAPQIYFTAPFAFLQASVSMNLSVLFPGNNQKVGAFLIRDDFLFKANIFLNGSTTISGRFLSGTFNSTLVSSEIGNVSVPNWDSMLNLFLYAGVLPVLNQYATKGFPIPSTLGLTLKNSDLSLLSNFVEVQTDFVYSPSAKHAMVQAVAQDLAIPLEGNSPFENSISFN